MKQLTLFLFFASFGNIYCQNDTTSIAKIVKNSLYVEFVGNPTLYAINYDRIILDKANIAIYGTVGYTYILGKYSNNIGFKQQISMPNEINHAKYILGGSMMFNKQLFWDIFKIQRVAKNKRNRVSYLELGFFHIWNSPKTSPENVHGGSYERGNPWNNLYVGYNLFRTKPGVFVRFGASIYFFKKGPNVIDEISSGYRISPLPFPRLIVGYAF
jgi:hypothetical protein